jgi:hypothetical protein
MTRVPRVCLFTSFHPDHGGGGSTCLQSVIPHFTRVEVCWMFLGAQEAIFANSRRVGDSFLGGGLLRDLVSAPFLWAGWRGKKLRKAVAAIQAEQADAFWFVAMNEGILVGNALADKSSIPFHVSVQDDQSEAICRRSRRYRWLELLASRSWYRLLRRAASVDVISTGMQEYYRQRRQIDSLVFHPYVPQLPPAPPSPDNSEIHVGHMGTLYSENEVRSFMQGARITAAKLGRRLRLTFIGGNRFDPSRHVSQVLPEVKIENLPSLPEMDAMERLRDCHVLYAMYPFEERSRVFRTTSLPTKLSSYIQLQRPIFAHTPGDSTLAAFVRENCVGVECQSLLPEEISHALASLLEQPIPPDHFESARQKEYGRDRVIALEDALLRLTRGHRESL